MPYITVIGTDPQYGHNVMHSAARPWAVAEVEMRADGTKNITHIFTRHATHKGACASRRIRQLKQRAYEAAVRAECERPVPYGC